MSDPARTTGPAGSSPGPAPACGWVTRTGTIAYAGEPGAFAEDAVLAAFGDVDARPLGSFRAVFDAVVGGPGRGRRRSRSRT